MCIKSKKRISYIDEVNRLISGSYIIPPKNYDFSSNSAIAYLYRCSGIINQNYGRIVFIVNTIFKINDKELLEWSRLFHSFISSNAGGLNKLESYVLGESVCRLNDTSRKFFSDYIGSLNQFVNELAGICFRLFSNTRRNPIDKNVFIVHGHDNELKNYLKKCLKKKGFFPIILSDMNDSGISLFDKFEKYANTCMKAVILMTKDDYVSKNNLDYFQARPNVLVEFGYFLNMLERKDIVVLLEKGCSKPSDVDGVAYIEYDKNPKEVALKVIDSLEIN